MSTGKGAEGSQQGRGSAGVTGKEVGGRQRVKAHDAHRPQGKAQGHICGLSFKEKAQVAGDSNPLPRLEQPPCQDGGGQKVGAQKKVKVKGGPGGNWTERAAEVNGMLSKSRTGFQRPGQG